MKQKKNRLNTFNSAVFRRALALGGTVEQGDNGPIVTVPEHAIAEFQAWMAKGVK